MVRKVIIICKHAVGAMKDVLSEAETQRVTHHYELRGYWDGPLDLLFNTPLFATFVLGTGYHDFSLEQLVGDLQSIISSLTNNHRSNTVKQGYIIANILHLTKTTIS